MRRHSASAQAAFAEDAPIETDAAGEPCVIDRAAAALPPGLRYKAHVGFSATRTRRRAWRDNPLCVACEKRVGSPDNCGLVVQPDGTHRVAHRTRCFVRAVLRANPTLTTGDRLAPAAEATHT